MRKNDKVVKLDTNSLCNKKKKDQEPCAIWPCGCCQCHLIKYELINV